MKSGRDSIKGATNGHGQAAWLQFSSLESGDQIAHKASTQAGHEQLATHGTLIAASFFFSIMSLMIKLLGERLHITQILLIRQAGLIVIQGQNDVLGVEQGFEGRARFPGHI